MDFLFLLGADEFHVFDVHVMPPFNEYEKRFRRSSPNPGKQACIPTYQDIQKVLICPRVNGEPLNKE
jgi:hypothetical protein